MVLALSAVAGAADSLAGSWSSTVTVGGMDCKSSQILARNGTYKETLSCTNMGLAMPTATKTGAYHVFANHVVAFDVYDWDPKIQTMPGPNGVGTAFPIRKPPGGRFKYVFTSPNTIVWRDLDHGGSITYQRVH